MKNSPAEASHRVKEAALRLGFSAVGIAPAEAVPQAIAKNFLVSVAEGRIGEMQYLARNETLRFDPCKLVNGCLSIICVAMNYYPASHQASNLPQIARYAYGDDYHPIIRRRLGVLLDFIRAEIDPMCSGRAFADSAPLLERYWAVRAGLGWLGRSGLVLIPHAGSYFFLGELLVSTPFLYDEPITRDCGRCRSCIDACPTGALANSPEAFDARRCLSYLTIENPNDIPPDLAVAMGNRIYGCDICQEVCPHNCHAVPGKEDSFSLRPAYQRLTPEAWEQITEEDFNAIFHGSPIMRAGYHGLRKNLRALKYRPDKE